MTIILDHTIVPVGDRRRSAQLLGELVGVVPGEPTGPFIPVQVNGELTLDFDERFGARPGHYAFLVDDALFDRTLEKASMLDLEWGSAPRLVDRQIDKHGSARRVFIRDPDGVAYEFFTAGRPASQHPRAPRLRRIVFWSAGTAH